MLARSAVEKPQKAPAHRRARACVARVLASAISGIALAAAVAGALVAAGAPCYAHAALPVERVRAAVQDACEALVPADQPPAWATWHARSYVVDVPGSDEPGHLVVGDARATLVVDNQVVFASPDDWWVADACASDLDGDGQDELVFLAWRRGNYGSSRPFWEPAGTAEGFSQHVFIYGWRDGVLQPRWMSSQTGVAAERMGLSEAGEVLLTACDGSATAWAWEDWGLTLVREDPAPASRATLLVTGDVIGHVPVYEGSYVAASRSFDFSPIFAPVTYLVQGADCAIVGQETPFVSDPSLRSGYPRFATPNTLGEALVEAGFDVVLAASNHVFDAGERGVRDTLAFWEDHPEVMLLGLHPDASDAAEIDVLTVNDMRLAMLNATYGTNGYALPEDSPYQVDLIADGDALADAVARAGEQADLVVCFLHMGEEYGHAPTAEQRTLAECLVDAGADLVVYAHSHVASSWERLTTANGSQGVVCWGLGNFVAVQDRLDCMLGVAARVTVVRAAGGEACIADVELVPTVCHTSRTGAVAVYPLVDYTDELAAEHYLNDMGQPVTVEGLWGLYGEWTAC